MAIELYLDITSISDNLLTESFKYALVADTTGSTNYDYNNIVLGGNFSNYTVGNNLITLDLEVTSSTTTNYQFIIYIDGNMKNDPNMQENSLVGNLLVGNCGEDATPLNSLVYQAIYSETDNSLTFVHTTPLTVGDTYNNKIITALYTGFDTNIYAYYSPAPWDSNRENITTVNFDSVIKPKSTAYWFQGFSNITELELEKLDTSNVTNMQSMFSGCSSLTSLDVSGFNTSNVTNMQGMFSGCSSLIELDLSGWDTSKVTNMRYMFNGCNKLTTEITIRNSGTTSYTSMFSNAATATDEEGNSIAQITVNYIPDNPNTDTNESTEAIVDAMKATGTGNIVKGCYGDNCPVEE